MQINLSCSEEKGLLLLHKSTTDKRKADRIKILLLLHKGYSQKEVSNILFLDEDSISKWKYRFIERESSLDLESWLLDNYVGYVGKLSYVCLSRLRTYCRTFNVGKKAVLQNYIESNYGLKYSLSGLQKLLARIGHSYKAIRRIPGNADVSKQAAFIKKIDLLVSELSDKQTIMYMDSVHPQHNTVCSKVWIEKGTQRWIPSNTGRERVNINGIYNPFTQEVYTEQASTINAKVTIKLLKQVIDKNPNLETIYLVSDNARYNKCEEVATFLATQDKIKMCYLPPYSPNLNLIERLWKVMHEQVINLKYYDVLPKFKKAINDFFDNIAQYKQILKNRITFNFQTFDNAETADG
jgi:transposase